MIELIFIGALALLFVSAALAPLESLGWWAGWSGKPPEKGKFIEEDAANAGNEPEADFYLVYLSGIGAISGTSVPAEEYPFIHGLEERLVGAKVISDIYPYSVTNNGLTGQRFFAWLWKWIENISPKSPAAVLSFLVNARNTMQLFVSADRRYGPIYNLGIANEIHRGLVRHGYRKQSGKPIVLLGWSGGGQIAIGSVTYLAPLPGPIYVISLGGMLSDDIGFNQVDHLWHLYGTADPIQAMGGVLFSGRWTIKPNSPWNEAMAGGKIDIICLGPYKHNSAHNYFDMTNKLPNDKRGRTYGQKTLDTIVYVLQQSDILKTPSTVFGNARDMPLIHAAVMSADEYVERTAALAAEVAAEEPPAPVESPAPAEPIAAKTDK
ncbi:MAG: hypothetical protein IPK16_32450 [Anaerolineales bacterium]|nr:hypothetical protein [Anaerolineales bacterium]